ncbi:MAG: sterol desaturase family protein, partial [Alphaproteobacteria bacterium]|nr:sterol desaturase family protein [Alphaproteobacteria bacterium]
MPDFDPVTYAVPAFVLLVLAEMLWARRRRPHAYEPRDTLTSLAFGLGSTVAGVVFGGAILAAALWLYDYRLFDFGESWWAVWWAWPL